MENPASPVAHDDITTFLIRSNSHYTKSKLRTAHPSRLRKLYQNPDNENLRKHFIPRSIGGVACHFAKELPLEPGDDPAHPKYLLSCSRLIRYNPSLDSVSELNDEDFNLSRRLSLFKTSEIF